MKVSNSTLNYHPFSIPSIVRFSTTCVLICTRALAYSFTPSQNLTGRVTPSFSEQPYLFLEELLGFQRKVEQFLSPDPKNTYRPYTDLVLQPEYQSFLQEYDPDLLEEWQAIDPTDKHLRIDELDSSEIARETIALFLKHLDIPKALSLAALMHTKGYSCNEALEAIEYGLDSQDKELQIKALMALQKRDNGPWMGEKLVELTHKSFRLSSLFKKDLTSWETRIATNASKKDIAFAENLFFSEDLFIYFGLAFIENTLPAAQEAAFSFLQKKVFGQCDISHEFSLVLAGVNCLSKGTTRELALAQVDKRLDLYVAEDKQKLIKSLVHHATSERQISDNKAANQAFALLGRLAEQDPWNKTFLDLAIRYPILYKDGYIMNPLFRPVFFIKGNKSNHWPLVGALCKKLKLSGGLYTDPESVFLIKFLNTLDILQGGKTLKKHIRQAIAEKAISATTVDAKKAALEAVLKRTNRIIGSTTALIYDIDKNVTITALTSNKIPYISKEDASSIRTLAEELFINVFKTSSSDRKDLWTALQTTIPDKTSIYLKIDHLGFYQKEIKDALVQELHNEDPSIRKQVLDCILKRITKGQVDFSLDNQIANRMLEDKNQTVQEAALLLHKAVQKHQQYLEL